MAVYYESFQVYDRVGNSDLIRDFTILWAILSCDPNRHQLGIVIKILSEGPLFLVGRYFFSTQQQWEFLVRYTRITR